MPANTINSFFGGKATNNDLWNSYPPIDTPAQFLHSAPQPLR